MAAVLVETSIRYFLAVIWLGLVVMLVLLAIQVFLRNATAEHLRRLWVISLLLVPFIAFFQVQIQSPHWFSTLPFTPALTATAATSTAAISDSDRITAGFWFAAFYGFGLTVTLTWLSLDLLRIRRWIRSAKPINEQRFLDTLEAAQACLDANQSCFLLSGKHVPYAFTTGVLIPRILLPFSLLQRVTDEQLRDLLLHETMHVKQRDPLLLLALAFLRAVFFFHPLYWYGFRRVVELTEWHTDDRVIETTGEPAVYAASLLGIADHLYANSTQGFKSSRRKRKSAFCKRIERLSAGLDPARHVRPWQLGLGNAALSCVFVAVLVFPYFIKVEVSASPAGDPEVPILSSGTSEWSRNLVVHDMPPRKTLEKIHSMVDPDQANLIAKHLGLIMPVEILQYGHYHQKSDGRKITFLKGIDHQKRSWTMSLDRTVGEAHQGKWIWRGIFPDDPGIVFLGKDQPSAEALETMLRSWIDQRLTRQDFLDLFHGEKAWWEQWSPFNDERNIAIGIIDLLNKIEQLR